MILMSTPTRRFHLGIVIPTLAAAVLAIVFLPRASSKELEPIVLGASPQGTEMVSANGTAADAKFAFWAPTEFTLQPGVDAPAGSAPVWRFTSAERSDVAALAERLGEDPRQLTEERYDETGPTNFAVGNLYASSNGYFSWSNTVLYNSPEMQERYRATSCAVAIPSSASEVPAENPSGTVSNAPSPVAPNVASDAASNVAADVVAVDSIVSAPTEGVVACTPANLPAAPDLPSDVEAIAMVKSYYPTSASFQVSSRTEWGVTLTVAYELADGSKIADVGFAEVNDLGVLSIAGHFTDLERVGKYPTISARAAATRLIANYGPMPYARSATPEISMPCQYPADTETTSTSGSLTENSPSLACAPSEPVVVELVAVRPIHTFLFDATGTVWVVPAWSYTDAAGQAYSAVALAEKYLQQVSPPSPVVSSPIEPGSVPGSSGTANPTEPSLEPVPDAIDLSTFIGLTESNAEKLASTSGYTVRIIARDGERYPATMDYRSDRINLSIMSGKVTEATVG
jgi:hypothetical protein